MKRSSSGRGPAVCHECREELGKWIPVHTPELPVGARWKYCPECARRLKLDLERAGASRNGNGRAPSA